MGIFSKILPVTRWSDEDLAEETFKISKLQVDALRNTPWGDRAKLDTHQAKSAQLEMKLKEIENELARRGLTYQQIQYRSLMRKIGK